MYLIGAVILIGSISISYFLSQRNALAARAHYRSQNCTALGKDVLFGPEDLTVSHRHKLLFVSSHDRRGRGVAGGLFAVNLTTNEVLSLPVSVPTIFRPHGLTLYESDELTRLYVISHSESALSRHTIEVFDFDVATVSLKYIKTLRHHLLTSPNDLYALGLDELLISNDHGAGSAIDYLIDDILQQSRAQLVYYRASLTTDIWYGTPVYAAFGNGVITRKENDEIYIYHASSVKYTLAKYHLQYSRSGDAPIELQHVYTDTLPVSPDNIEYDPVSDSLVIGAHVSTRQFMSHAIFRTRSPSAVIQYHSYSNYTLLYYDSGAQLSGCSVGTMYWTESGKAKLYVGQVFDPFILLCM